MVPSVVPGGLATARYSNLQRCEELWFDDGNVILKTRFALFRVYREMLAANSPVFKDMFSVLQPQSVESHSLSMDGCPLVRLRDSAADVECFLKSLLIYGYYEKITGPDVDISMLQAVLRLSTKYKTQNLRRRTIAKLASLYPTTLEAWDNIPNETRELLWRHDGSIVSAADECNLRAIIPAAMYFHMARHGRISPLERHQMVGCHSAHVNQNRCIRVRCSINSDWREVAFDPIINGTEGTAGPCQSRGTCGMEGLKWLGRERYMLSGQNYWINPLLNEFGSTGYASMDLCKNCTITYRMSYEKAREEVWNNLPHLLGLRNWTVLRAELEDLLNA